MGGGWWRGRGWPRPTSGRRVGRWSEVMGGGSWASVASPLPLPPLLSLPPPTPPLPPQHGPTPLGSQGLSASRFPCPPPPLSRSPFAVVVGGLCVLPFVASARPLLDGEGEAATASPLAFCLPFPSPPLLLSYTSSIASLPVSHGCRLLQPTTDTVMTRFPPSSPHPRAVTPHSRWRFHSISATLSLSHPSSLTLH